MEKKRTEIELTRLRDRLYRYARSLLDNGAEAEDATQDALERLWQHSDEWGVLRSIEAFAMTILRNGCIDRLRRRRAVTEEPRDTLQNGQDAVEQWSNRELVRTAMARLPQRQREVLHLKEIEGYATHEIGITCNFRWGSKKVDHCKIPVGQ